MRNVYVRHGSQATQICPPLLRDRLHQQAVVYVRQATLGLGSEQSIRGQRDLVQVARAWGFRRVELIEDLGFPASGSLPGRPGFTALRDRLGSGDVAVVLCRDHSRLARNPVDLELFLRAAERHHILLRADGQLYDSQEN